MDIFLYEIEPIVTLFKVKIFPLIPIINILYVPGYLSKIHMTLFEGRSDSAYSQLP